MIVDVHTHAFPDLLAPKAMDVLSKAFGVETPDRDGTLATLLSSMTEAGVERSFLANIATRPEQGPKILEWCRQIASDCVVPLGSVHPQSPDWERELEAIAEAGLPGIKLHAQYQRFVVDASEMFPIYRKAAGLGLFVLFHAGFDIAFPGDESASPKRLAHVRRRVEGLVMIAAHFGGWQTWNEVDAHLAGLDIYLDTSYMHQLDATLIERLLLRHPHDRILFGSDSPWLSQKKAIRFIRNLPIGADSVAMILGKNALRLHPSLRLPPVRQTSTNLACDAAQAAQPGEPQA